MESYVQQNLAAVIQHSLSLPYMIGILSFCPSEHEFCRSKACFTHSQKKFFFGTETDSNRENEIERKIQDISTKVVGKLKNNFLPHRKSVFQFSTFG
jgi:hypothetical protein